MNWYEETKQDFIKNISDSYTLNLAMSILEDRKELLDTNLDLQKQNAELKEENEKYKGVIDKLKECIEKNKKNTDDSGTYVETYTGWKLIPEILEELLDIVKEEESND